MTALVIAILAALTVLAAFFGALSFSRFTAGALEYAGVRIVAPDSITQTYNGRGIEYTGIYVTHYGAEVSSDEYDVLYYDEDGTPVEGLPVNAGTYSVTVSVPVEEPEYGAVTRDCILVIEPAPVTVYIQGANVFTYSGNTAVRTISVTGISQSDAANVDVVASYTNRDTSETVSAPVNAGTYDMSFSLYGTAAANYEIAKIHDDRAEGAETVTIRKRTLTVTADSVEAVYGEPLPEFTYTITGFVGTDTAENALTERPTITSNAETVGVHTITPSGGAAENYEFSYVSGTLTINGTSVSLTMPDSVITMDITGVFSPDTEYIGNIYAKDSEQADDLREHIRNYRVADWTSVLEAIFYFGPTAGSESSPDDQPIQISINNLTLDSSRDFFIVVVDSYGVVSRITNYRYVNGTMTFETYSSDGAIMIYSAFHNTIIITIVVCVVILFLILLLIAAAVKYRNDKREADSKRKSKRRMRW